MASLQEHTQAVTQLAVASDHLYFASASADSTVKVWRGRGLDRATAHSALTYRRHTGAVTALAALENSHSLVTGSEDGTVHVWRVDAVGESSSASGSLMHLLHLHSPFNCAIVSNCRWVGPRE